VVRKCDVVGEEGRGGEIYGEDSVVREMTLLVGCLNFGNV
jgi:hypothetical protein